MCASVHEQGAIRACCQAEPPMGQPDMRLLCIVYRFPISSLASFS
jgi:hypothetical protein